MKIHFVKIRKISSQGRYFFLAILLVVTSFLGILPTSTSVNAAIGSVNQFNTPVGTSEIGAGPDGNMWYTSIGPLYTTRVGKISSTGTYTEYLNRTVGAKYLQDITTGSDGNIWYSETTTSQTSRIVKMTTSGTVLGQYTIPNTVYPAESMVIGPGGDIWFTIRTNIGRINTSGAITIYPTPIYSIGDIRSITPGPDGNIWYAASLTSQANYNSVGKMTPGGSFTNYQFQSWYNYNEPIKIVTGSDGNLWFTMTSKALIVRVSTSGVMTNYNPGTGSQPYTITAGSDGNLWYASNSNAKVGRLTTSGIFTEFSAPGLTTSAASNIVAGPDGAVWIQHTIGTKITRVAIEVTSQAVSFTSASPTNAVIEGPTYTPTASATSGLPVTITVDTVSTGVCSIDGSGLISFQGAGTCTVNADQAGNADYKPAPRVQQSFNVLPVNADSSVALNCPSNALVGDTIACTITVANNGPAASENASLTALFPNSFSDVSLAGGGTLSGQRVTWTTPSLASGGSVTLTLTVTLSAPGKQRVSAALLQTSPDPSSLNNIVDTTMVVS